MRKEFSSSMEKIASADDQVIFLTGDLGFMALENVRSSIKKRFINAGVSEQNMISVAAGLASQGLKPVCYSIAPFAAFRPAEQIRLDVCLHNMNVKIVGNGGGYGYGIMGATHHALEDIAVLSSFQHMTCFIPYCNEEVDSVLNEMMKREGPGYLRLGFGNRPKEIPSGPYTPVKKIMGGGKVTVIGMGPVVLNALKALEDPELRADVFIVSEIPLKKLPADLTDSLKSTGKVLIMEEHVRRGGLGEHLASLFLENGIAPRTELRFAVGYPDSLYGSQAYHQKTSGLDSVSLSRTIKELADE
jgi:transketolase